MLTDLLERPLEGEDASDGGSIALSMRPFQLRTVRFSGVSVR